MITIKQIYYKEEQLPGLDYLPFHNPVPTEREERYIFLESECISRAVSEGQHKGLSKFGLVGTNYRQKINECKKWGRDISNRSSVSFTPEKFSRFCLKNTEADLISFTSHPQHSVFNFAEKYHKGITKLANDTLSEIGFDIDLNAHNRFPVYFNYFIATPEVLEGFTKELLNPVIDLAINNPEFKKRYWQPSGYPKQFPIHLQKIYSSEFWPFHPFIAERLISLYISKHSLKVKML